MSNFRISDVHSETLEEVPSSPKKQTEPMNQLKRTQNLRDLF